MVVTLVKNVVKSILRGLNVGKETLALLRSFNRGLESEFHFIQV